MALLPVLLGAVLLLVPIGLAVHLLCKRFTARLEQLLGAASTAAFGGYALLVGRWDLFSYYLRPAVGLLVLIALVVSFARNRGLPWWHRPEKPAGWVNLVVNALVTVGFVGLAAYTASGLAPSRPAVDLDFPLRGGVAYVGQGGANPLLNYHNTNRSQAYALDVIALNGAGLHAWGLAPAEPDRYAVWGWNVHSPCTGTVVEARDGLADLNPPETDTTNRSGNHVVVRCAGQEPEVDVLLAHLRQGSVTVTPGAAVTAGDPVGNVGNTGNTSEPHLHVHAVRTGSGTALDGEAVPIRFGGRFLVRNDLVFG